MDDITRLILRLLLEQEEGSEQKTASGNNDSNSDQGRKPAGGRSVSDHIRADLEKARSRVYTEHNESIEIVPEVPIWEKYALTLPEAAKYFHLGYNKIREIVRKDRYAEYLLWNGGRVYIKRELFEKFLDGETQV